MQGATVRGQARSDTGVVVREVQRQGAGRAVNLYIDSNALWRIEDDPLPAAVLRMLRQLEAKRKRAARAAGNS